MQPKEMEHLPLQLEKMFLELQNRIMRDVVRRIKKTGGITSTADYQLNRIQIIGNSTEFIESEIKRLFRAY
ncbi:MAG: phage minor capsid protein [Mediterraneibacter gnavus]